MFYKINKSKASLAYKDDATGKFHKGQEKEDIIDYFRASGDNFHWLDSEATDDDFSSSSSFSCRRLLKRPLK